MITEMKDDLLKEFLPTWCSSSFLGTTYTDCIDKLRFTDLKNSTQLYDGGTVNGTGIEGQVTCK